MPRDARSGRFVVRLPPELHADLVEQAAKQGVSLNTLIIALLAGGIGWGGGPTARLLSAER